MPEGISLKAVRKIYGNGTEALRGVGFEVGPGERFCLLGPNGAGKSTLVRILTGLSRRDSGEVTVSGIDPGIRPRTLQSTIGVVTQDCDMDPLATVEEMLSFQAMLFGASKADAKARTDELIEEFDLAEASGKKASDLSGGNRRRVHCALGMVHRPGILFLDEPTTGLDPEARRRFWSILDEVGRAEGVAVFLTTQYLEEAEAHTESMALLFDGEVLYDGAISGFLERVSPDGGLSLEESYLAWIDAHRQGLEEAVHA